MKISVFIAFLLSIMAFTNQILIDEARMNYNKVIKDKVLCKKMIVEFEKAKNISALNLAYLGGFQTIWANHVFSPLKKLNTFNTGKKHIEMAIKNEPDNAEIKFIRLSVQKNAPSFLGYRSNIKEDTEFIKRNLHQIQSEILQENIKLLLEY